MGSGNRYVFASALTGINITASTTNVNQTYGTPVDLSTNLQLASADPVGSVYTTSSGSLALSDVFSTLPTVTSLGNTSTATVAGGPYAITASGGVLKPSFAVTFNNVGLLTVTPKLITATGTFTGTKVYDGATAATGTGTGITFTGVMNNDTVTVDAVAGTLADRNVGTGKVYNITSATLGGTDAANYSINPTWTATGTGSITQQSSVTWVGATNGNWSTAANWALTSDLTKIGALPDGGNVALAIIPSSFTATVTADTANGYTGKVQVNGGTLAVGTETYLGAVPSGVVADAITLNGGTLQATNTFTLSTNRGITLGASGGTFAVDATKSLSYAGVIAGTGGLTKSGSGTMTLSGGNTYSGGSTISAGTLKVGIASVGSVGAVTSGALGTANATVVSGAAIDLYGFTLSNALSVAGTGISSGGSLFNTALTAASVTGPITLTANSTFISTPGLTLGTVNGGNFSLAVTAGTGAGTGDITLNGPVTFSGENISTFTASRNININAPINVNGTTAASGITLVYNKSNTTGDYNFGLSSTGSGVGMTASFAGAINFASTASTFTTQNNATAKSYILVDAFTSTNPGVTTFYCSSTAQCGANTQNFALTGDIDASTFTTTGAAAGAKYANMRALGTNSVAYSGIFTGLGHSITGLSLTGTNNVGLFQNTGNGALIRDVRLSAITLSGGTSTGALVAAANSSLTMSNVVMDAVTGANTISSNNNYLGALVGNAGSGTLTNIYVLNTNVTGTSYVGGVMGGTSMTATNVHKVGSVTATGISVGGAFGAMSGNLTNVDSVGSVTDTGSNYNVGGLIGDAGSSNITNAFATGAVTASSSYQVGGLLGYHGGGSLTNVASSGGNISGTSSVGGLVGWYGSGTITTASTAGNVSGTTNVGGLVGYSSSTANIRVKTTLMAEPSGQFSATKNWF